MNKVEEITLADNGMVSLLEETQQLQEKHQNSALKISKNPIKIGLAKLSKNMANVCGIRMRYEQNLNKSTLHNLLMLNPESQIKILEENLKFLFQEDSTYNYFQIKSNHLSLKTGYRDSVIESANAQPKTLILNSAKPTFHLNNNKVPIERKKRRGLDEAFRNNLSDEKKLFSVKTGGISSNMLKDTKRVNNKRVLSLAAQPSPLKQYFYQNGSEEYDSSRKDADNQYEFTLEQEKIVSFVCCSSPPRKQTGKSSFSTECSDDQTVCSDHDSDSHSKLWNGFNGESDSLSETVSNTFCESNKTKKTTVDSPCFPQFQLLSGSSKLLWHPPTSLSCDSLETPKAKLPSHPAEFTHSNSSEPDSEIRVSSSDSVQRKMESSFSRETTLFRETSLRGCYNMENIVKGKIPPQAHVQQELKSVRESIFSAVRSQKSNDDLVSDSILSILDIFKSWLKLNSHFKGKEFVNILESNGANLSILNDFVQWQCVSRVFIDKMIDTLQKITPKVYGFNASSTLDEFSSLTLDDAKNNVHCSGLHNVHNRVSSTNTSPNENDIASSNCEINSNKNWKQRRFFLDQPKQVIVESKNTCRLNCLNNTYNNCSQTYCSCRSNMVYGQGDPPLSYNSESHFCKVNNPFPFKNSYSGQGDVNFSPNSYNILQGNASNSYQPDKNTNLPCISKNVKHFTKDRGCTKSQTSIGSNMTVDFPTLGLPLNPLCQATAPNFSIVPPFYNSQMCYSSFSNYQLNPSQLTVKKNPIQCTDSDVVEKCTKSSYMKPGSYNIPEKPLGFQKIINNNIPIEDSPVVGVPFLFSGAQGNILSPNNLSSTSPTEKQVSIEDGVKKSEEKWKAAMTSAETFRDNLMACKSDSGPNLKLSDAVSLNTHYLLSDEFSQGSSSNDFKLSSESEELNPCERASPSMDVSIVEARVKTSDWLMQSFNRAVLENEREAPNYMSCMKLNNDNDSELDVKNVHKTNCTSENVANNNKDGISSYRNSTGSLSNSQNYFQHGIRETFFNIKPELSVINTVDKSSSSNPGMTEKNLNRNNNKPQDEISISSLFDNKSLFRRKSKSIFKRAITKPISSKLEDILNCICNTEVSSLVEFDFKSEKEVSKLDIKVRCPLYLQAMRCKLVNHSYDTLDQALSDFQKYFMDIRNRNKGDKQSTDVVSALEHLFLDLVEKHFGSCQSTAQYFGLRDLSSSVKPRKSKKISRRC